MVCPRKIQRLGKPANQQTSKAFEFIMRDVIDGMEELANMCGFSPKAGDCLQILGIDTQGNVVDMLPPETRPIDSCRDSAVMISLNRNKQATVGAQNLALIALLQMVSDSL